MKFKIMKEKLLIEKPTLKIVPAKLFYPYINGIFRLAIKMTYK